MKIPYTEIASLIECAWKDKDTPSKEIQVVTNWLAEEGYHSPQEQEKRIPQAHTWKEFTAELVASYCDEINSPTFTLKDFQDAKKLEIENFSKSNKHPFDKIRQQLQFLRKDGYVRFVDNNGTYSLTCGNDSVFSS